MIASKYRQQYGNHSAMPLQRPVLTLAICIAALVLNLAVIATQRAGDYRLTSLLAFNGEHPWQLWRYLTYDFAYNTQAPGASEAVYLALTTVKYAGIVLVAGSVIEMFNGRRALLTIYVCSYVASSVCGFGLYGPNYGKTLTDITNNYALVLPQLGLLAALPTNFVIVSFGSHFK